MSAAPPVTASRGGGSSSTPRSAATIRAASPASLRPLPEPPARMRRAPVGPTIELLISSSIVGPTGARRIRAGGSGRGRREAGEAARIVAADRGVLEDPPPLDAVTGGAADMVDHAIRDAARDGGIRQIVYAPRRPVPSLPLAVAPLRVTAVAGADVQGDRGQRVNLDHDRLAAPRLQRDGGALGMAGAAAVPDVDLRPAQLLPAAVAPDPHGVAVDAVAVRPFLCKQDDGVVIESQLAVHPPESLEARFLGPARRLRLPHGAQAPGSVTRPDPASGVDGDLIAADAQDSGPGSELREA